MNIRGWAAALMGAGVMASTGYLASVFGREAVGPYNVKYEYRQTRNSPLLVRPRTDTFTAQSPEGHVAALDAAVMHQALASAFCGITAFAGLGLTLMGAGHIRSGGRRGDKIRQAFIGYEP